VAPFTGLSQSDLHVAALVSRQVARRVLKEDRATPRRLDDNSLQAVAREIQGLDTRVEAIWNARTDPDDPASRSEFLGWEQEEAPTAFANFGLFELPIDATAALIGRPVVYRPLPFVDLADLPRNPMADLPAYVSRVVSMIDALELQGDQDKMASRLRITVGTLVA
jgi:hypothetical protein